MEAVRGFVGGSDVFVSWPTGYGKSDILCYAVKLCQCVTQLQLTDDTPLVVRECSPNATTGWINSESFLAVLISRCL